MFKEFFKLFLIENAALRDYACLMLDCADLKNALKVLQDGIDKSDIYDNVDREYGLETECHITVLYGIHEDDGSIVKEQLELKPCEYELTGLSLFENDDYDVLKCSVKSKDLKDLNKQCVDKLEFTNKFPTYIPHMTVAYLNVGAGKKYTKHKSPIFNKKHSSNKFLFSNSESKKSHWKV